MKVNTKTCCSGCSSDWIAVRCDSGRPVLFQECRLLDPGSWSCSSASPMDRSPPRTLLLCSGTPASTTVSSRDQASRENSTKLTTLHRWRRFRHGSWFQFELFFFFLNNLFQGIFCCHSVSTINHTLPFYKHRKLHRHINVCWPPSGRIRYDTLMKTVAASFSFSLCLFFFAPSI